jgi:hypothetical protein
MAWSDFWLRMTAAHAGLLADRRPASVAWRLSDPDADDRVAAWLLHDHHGRMLGLALARAVAAAPPAAPRAELMDWCVLPDAPANAQALLLATVGEWAAERGLPFLEAKRFTGLAARQLAALGGRTVALPGDANWWLARPGAGEADPAGWSMTGIDGDDWFSSPWRGSVATPAAPGTPATPATQTTQATQAMRAPTPQD